MPSGDGHGSVVLQTAQQHVVDWLRDAIMLREFRPGSRLIQEEVAERIGVSVAPVREALRVLEQEGQVTYRPRRGYFVSELNMADLDEIYALRMLLEERAVRHALPTLDEETLERIEAAAQDCVEAAEAGDVLAELAANRRFHFAILDTPDQPHLARLIHLLWESTEPYRAMYFNSPAERRASVTAHRRIVSAVRRGDADQLVAELDAHRARALVVLRGVLEAS
jgi:DNA-binding GntR family transcriptional regulator